MKAERLLKLSRREQTTKIDQLLVYSLRFLLGDSEAYCCIRVPHDHLLLDSALNIGPLISLWKLTNSKITEKKL
jgi:hypothetical protein